MMIDDNKLFKVAKDNNTYLMLPTVDRNNNGYFKFDFDIVYMIPSSQISYYAEFPIEENIIRIFVLYWSNDKERILESFDFNLEKRRVVTCYSDINKRRVNGAIEAISPTAFCYKSENNIKTILSVYGNQIQPQLADLDTYVRTTTGKSLRINDVTLGEYIDNEKREMILHIGTEEKLHIFIAPPTKMYQAFRVYKQVYSELLDKQYDLFFQYDFVDYGLFIRYFADSDLADKIVEKSEKHKEYVRRKVFDWVIKCNPYIGPSDIN